MTDDQNLEVEEAVDERPDWLPEKYKSHDDLLSHHRQLEDERRRLAEQANAQQRQIEQLLAAQEAAQQQTQQTQPNYQDDRWLEAWDRDPVGTAAYLADQRAQLIVDQRLRELQAQQQQQYAPIGSTQQELVANYAKQQLANQYDDWVEYEPRVLEAIANGDIPVPDDVLTSVEKTHKILSAAYKVVKADDLHARAEKAGREQAQLGRERKLGAQTMPGGSSGASRSVDDYHENALRLHAGGSAYGTQ